MAIIACPVCKNRVSNKAPECPKCKTPIGSLSADKLAAQHREVRLQKLQSLTNQSMLALVLFLSGFGIMYWWQPENGSYNNYASIAAIAIGFSWYVVCRARIIWFKRKK
jgi:uncharacterized protein YbaR (Trm112 family)